ncbi:hypothetical protein [Fusibacter bizertensis]
MELTELALLIVVLLIPGTLHIKFYRSLRAIKTKKDWEDYFEVIIISVLCYFIYSWIHSILICTDKFEFVEASTLSFVSNQSVKIDYIEVFYSSIIGILLAFPFAYISKKKFINNIGRKLKVTSRISNEDLWYEFNCIDKIEWVTVRDYKSNLDYFGHLKNFSDSNENREMILENVTVFKDNTDTEYHVDSLYISRQFDDFSIEYFDFKKEEEKQNGKEQ